MTTATTICHALYQRDVGVTMKPPRPRASKPSPICEDMIPEESAELVVRPPVSEAPAPMPTPIALLRRPPPLPPTDGNEEQGSTTLSSDDGISVGVIAGAAGGGAALVIQPQEGEHEEQVVIQETWLRKDGLVVLLKDPVVSDHPAGAHVMTA